MQIINDLSRTSPHFPLTADCERCQSTLSVELTDVEFGRWKVGGYWFAGTEQIEERYTFDCAACGHANQVDPELIAVGSKQDMLAAYRAKKAAGAPII